VGLLALLCLASSGAAASGTYCWSDFPPNQFSTFDFELVASVSGPLPGGGYSYTYTLFRVDHGPRLAYRDLSHFSLRFPCGQRAVTGIHGAASGLVFSGTLGSASIEVSGANGLSEPALQNGCDRFHGLKLTWPGSPDVDGDGISYVDSGDDWVTFSFVADAPPVPGQWLAKGGQMLLDGGAVPVPDCPAPVPSLPVTWGTVKALYR
jgi:hypothetical protein